MSKPKVIVLSGYGLNCEEETAEAFNLAGGDAKIVHINDLLAKPSMLSSYKILAFPGGFSYGDDLGSGKAYANKFNNKLKKHLLEFVKKDKLVIGICNGFQILTNLGLLPGVLTFNDSNRYTDRWVDIKVTQPKKNYRVSSRASASETRDPDQGVSPWLKGIKSLSIPIAHGEGKFVASKELLGTLKKNKMIAGVYYKGEVCKYQKLTPNPNGSTLDIAILTSKNGRILGSMPHPERGMFFTQLPNWPLLKEKFLRAGKPLPKYANGLQIFKNGINYFSAKGGSASGGK